jgi:hypothetical protein
MIGPLLQRLGRFLGFRYCYTWGFHVLWNGLWCWLLGHKPCREIIAYVERRRWGFQRTLYWMDPGPRRVREVIRRKGTWCVRCGLHPDLPVQYESRRMRKFSFRASLAGALELWLVDHGCRRRWFMGLRGIGKESNRWLRKQQRLELRQMSLQRKTERLLRSTLRKGGVTCKEFLQTWATFWHVLDEKPRTRERAC